MATPPFGTVVLPGSGADGPIQFFTPAGAVVTPPTSNPECGAGVRGIVSLSNGQLCSSGGFPIVPNPTPNTTGAGVFAADFLSTVECETPSLGNLNSHLSRDDDDFFYGRGTSGGSDYLFQYDASGTRTATWNFGSGTILGIAVNGAGTIAYYIRSATPTVIRAWDLTGNTDLGIFVTETGLSPDSNFWTLMCTSAGEVFAMWRNTTGSAVFVRRYSAAAATIQDYSLMASGSNTCSIARGLTDDTFVVLYYNYGLATFSQLAFAEIEIATGDVVETWDPDDLAGFNYYGPIAVLGHATPAPDDEFTIIDSTVSPPTPVARDILQSWSISEQLNERGTMRFGVKSMDASYRPLLREQIDFNWASQHFFAGHIHHTDEGGLGGYGVVPIVTQCGATDFNALPDRRQVAITLPAGTLKSMLQLLDDYLTVYGVTLDTAQVNGPTIAEDLVFTLGTLTAILNKLSVVTGYAWNISYDKVLSMFEPGIVAAPFNIVDNDARVVGDVRVSPTTVNYGNHITVKWTVPAEKAYTFYIMTGNAGEGNTAKVGALTVTFKGTPVDPTDVQIGATTADTLASLASVIDGESDEVDAGVHAADAIRVTAKDAGASGNSIQTETNEPNGRWGVEGFGGISSHLGNGSDPALTGSVVAQNIPAQDGGANLYELVFEEPTATSEATAQALADGYLVRSLVQPREVRYRTRLHGLHPGMQQQIQVTGRNVDGPCLITGVDISPEGSALYNYDVTAVEGLIIVPSYQDGWRTLAGRVA